MTNICGALFVYLYLYVSTYVCMILFPFPCSFARPMDIPNLILISMDGFRHDYLQKMQPEDISNFTHFIDKGVTATNGLVNVFPSNTYPSHFSMLTGLFPETHGVVNNYFYDPKFDDSFSMKDICKNFDLKWFDQGAEPITVTNMKASAKRFSGAVMFPTALAPIKFYQPRVIPNAIWSNPMSWEERVNKLIEWFMDSERPINLGLLYFEEPDEEGHHSGTESNELKEKIKELDSVLGYLCKKLKENDLYDSMNIIITADHGMVNLSNKSIIIDNLVNRDLVVDNYYLDYHYGIVPLLRIKEDAKNEVENILFPNGNNIHDGFWAWHKTDKELINRHFSKNDRIPDYVLEANITVTFETSGYTRRAKGTHGYDPEKYHEMHPFFIAWGPAFKSGYKFSSMHQVDLYLLMCRILKITPAHNMGNPAKVMDLLAKEMVWYKTMEPTAITFVLVLILAASVSGVFGIAACQANRRHQRKFQLHNFGKSLLPQMRNINRLPEADSMLGNNTESEDDF